MIQVPKHCSSIIIRPIRDHSSRGINQALRFTVEYQARYHGKFVIFYFLVAIPRRQATSKSHSFSGQSAGQYIAKQDLRIRHLHLPVQDQATHLYEIESTYRFYRVE